MYRHHLPEPTEEEIARAEQEASEEVSKDRWFGFSRLEAALANISDGIQALRLLYVSAHTEDSGKVPEFKPYPTPASEAQAKKEAAMNQSFGNSFLDAWFSASGMTREQFDSAISNHQS